MIAAYIWIKSATIILKKRTIYAIIGGTFEKAKIEFYWLNGHTEFLEFLQTIPIKDKQKLVTTIATIQEHGL